MNANRYYLELAAAFVRGKVNQGHKIALSDDLRELPLQELHPPQLETICEKGRQAGLRLHKFKRTMGLARVDRVFGYLHAIAPESLLDIGSGRGAFLWPLLDTFPNLPVAAVDRLEHRIADLQAVEVGGVVRLNSCLADATALPFETNTFDVVTMLEVLEHIADAPQALQEAVRVAKRYVILSVPSKADDNPEHIHLFDRPKLQQMLETAGASVAGVDYVRSHLVVLAGVANS